MNHLRLILNKLIQLRIEQGAIAASLIASSLILNVPVGRAEYGFQKVADLKRIMGDRCPPEQYVFSATTFSARRDRTKDHGLIKTEFLIDP
jgi:hypothetical protein